MNQNLNQGNLSNILNSQNMNMNNMMYDRNISPNNLSLNHNYIKSHLLSNKVRNNPANYDVLIEMIIDDLLVENVFELQVIEETQERVKQKENMKCFIQDYYKNFGDFKKLEDEVFDKLNSHDYGIRLHPKNQVMLLDGKDDRRHIIYNNPFASAIDKSINHLNQISVTIEGNSIDLPSNDTNKNITKDKNKKINTKNKNNNKSKSKEKTENNKAAISKDKSKITKKDKKEISSPSSKANNSSLSINYSVQEQQSEIINNIAKKKNNEVNIQEKIKQNFINHLLTTNYDFDNNKQNETNSKVYYTVKLHKNLPDICEKYKKEYDEYMKTTGVFFVPNVFMLYEDVVNKLTSEIFDECVSKSIKELDEVALNLIRNEVEKGI